MNKLDACDIAFNQLKIIQQLFKVVDEIKNLSFSLQNLLEIYLIRLYYMSINTNIYKTDLQNIYKWYSKTELQYKIYVDKYATRS